MLLLRVNGESCPLLVKLERVEPSWGWCLGLRVGLQGGHLWFHKRDGHAILNGPWEKLSKAQVFW